MTVTAPATAPAPTTLHRLPPLPGQLISWPMAPPVPSAQATLDLDLTGPETEPEPEVRSAADRRAERTMRARAARFAMAMVEAVGGDRPVTQLVGWVNHEVYETVSTLAAAVSQTSDSDARARTGRPRLLSVHVSRPSTDAAEVCGHVRQGVRSRAVALRLELHRGRWICTALHLG